MVQFTTHLLPFVWKGKELRVRFQLMQSASIVLLFSQGAEGKGNIVSIQINATWNSSMCVFNYQVLYSFLFSDRDGQYKGAHSEKAQENRKNLIDKYYDQTNIK